MKTTNLICALGGVGGRLLSGNSGQVPQFMYHDATGQRMTLYVTTEGIEKRDTGFRFAREGPLNVFYWVDGQVWLHPVGRHRQGRTGQGGDGCLRPVGTKINPTPRSTPCRKPVLPRHCSPWRR